MDTDTDTEIMAMSMAAVMKIINTLKNTITEIMNMTNKQMQQYLLAHQDFPLEPTSSLPSRRLVELFWVDLRLAKSEDLAVTIVTSTVQWRAEVNILFSSKWKEENSVRCQQFNSSKVLLCVLT
eukprot:132804_1